METGEQESSRCSVAFYDYRREAIFSRSHGEIVPNVENRKFLSHVTRERRGEERERERVREKKGSRRRTESIASWLRAETGSKTFLRGRAAGPALHTPKFRRCVYVQADIYAEQGAREVRYCLKVGCRVWVDGREIKAVSHQLGQDLWARYYRCSQIQRYRPRTFTVRLEDSRVDSRVQSSRYDDDKEQQRNRISFSPFSRETQGPLVCRVPLPRSG